MEQIGFMKNYRHIQISVCVNLYKLIISEEGRIKARIFSCWDYTAGKLSHNNPRVSRVSNTSILFDNFQCLAGNQWVLLSCICSCLAVTGLADLPKYWWQVGGALNIQGSHYLGPDWLLIVWFTHTYCGSTRDMIQARWLKHLVHWLEMAPPFSTFSTCGGIWEDITAFTRNRIWKLSH